MSLKLDHQGHYISKLGRPEDAIAAAIRGGTDAECGIPGPWGPGNYFKAYMASTIGKGLLAEKELDRVAVRVWRTAFRLGMFEFKKKQDEQEASDKAEGQTEVDSDPWAHIGFSAIDSTAHREEVSW